MFGTWIAGTDRDLRDRPGGVRSEKAARVGKALGKGIAEFKRATEEVKETIEHEVRTAERAVELSKIKAAVEGTTQEQQAAAQPGTAQPSAPSDGSAPAQGSAEPASPEKGSDPYGKS